MIERKYEGVITVRALGEDDAALFLAPADYPLAELVSEDIEELGSTTTVAYWIYPEPRTLAELEENEAKKLDGAADADYFQRYGEITGYLWTDQELNIGGHDLLAELRSSLGSWCRLSIRFGEREG